MNNYAKSILGMNIKEIWRLPVTKQSKIIINRVKYCINSYHWL